MTVPAPARPRVTDEERRLLAMLAAGLTQRQIGQRIGRSVTATNNRLAGIYQRIGARNAPNAVAIAIRDGLISTGSRFKGVTWDHSHGKWLAKIQIDRVTHNLGRYDSEEDAARAYDAAAAKAWPGVARLNFPAGAAA